ncbi:MAG: hypothetical protein FJX67_16530 [Alphaproteobacteria bacterium]|nr:hypothetical protein [Alphaproteobacteria bacterium]
MKKSTPVRLSGAERFVNMLFALVIIAIGAIGLYTGDLLLPGKRTSGPSGVVLNGPSAWLMYGAMTCAMYALLAPVAGYYAATSTDALYLRLAKAAKICGWSLFGLASLAYVFGV